MTDPETRGGVREIVDRILRAHQLTYGTLLNRTLGNGTSQIYDDICAALRAALAHRPLEGATAGEIVREACAKAVEKAARDVNIVVAAINYAKTTNDWADGFMRFAEEAGDIIRALDLSTISPPPSSERVAEAE